MPTGGDRTDGPTLEPLDRHIINMLADEQWTTGALIDTAEERIRSGDLSIDGVEVPADDEDVDEDEDLIKRQEVYDSLRAFKRLGSIEYAHEPTSLYRLVYDPRKVSECQTNSNGG